MVIQWDIRIARARSVKHGERLLEEIKLESDHLCNERERVKQEIDRTLSQGKMLPIELHSWVEKAKAIELQVSEIVQPKQKNESPCIEDQRVRNMLDEIVDHLEKCPIEDAIIYDGSVGMSVRICTPLFDAILKYGPRTKKKAKMFSIRRRKSETKATLSDHWMSPSPNSETKATITADWASPSHHSYATESSEDAWSTKLQRSKDDEVTTTLVDEPKSMLKMKSKSEIEEVEAVNVAGSTMNTPYSSSRGEKEHEAVTLAELELESESASESASEVEPVLSFEDAGLKKITPVLSFPDEAQIETIYSESEETLLVSGGENLVISGFETKDLPPIYFFGKEDLPPIHETEADTSLSEAETEAGSTIERIVKKILGVMEDPKARTIGIYGRGGIGKTTVLKALNNNLKTENMFGSIIWVTVSRYWNIRKIQNEVARQLSICLTDSEPDVEVAKKILQALKGMKFLLLLDDTWENINLHEVGIPDPKPENGCRIILTTRSRDVCLDMATDWKIEVENVSKEEAWELFCEQVGGIVNSPKILDIAREIVKECRGLPLTIIVTARALRNENEVLEWEHALSKFRSLSELSKQNIGNDLLELSYDRLRDPDTKRCFLYCALLLEDSEIKSDDLIENFIKDSLIYGVSSKAHKKGLDIINNLLDASLLESVGGHCLKMHDVIKDLALWIMSSKVDDCQFLVGTDVQIKKPLKQELHQGSLSKGGDLSLELLENMKRTGISFERGAIMSRADAGLSKPPPEKEWEQTEMIFLMNNEISGLPEKPNCPNLLMLFLQRNRLLRSLPVSFFTDMPSLRVLNLSKTRIRCLPLSLFKLTKLQVLILSYCDSLDQLPPEVGNLEHIEVLDLQGTELYNLPNEIAKLRFLRNLQVSFYGSVDHGEYDNLPPILISHDIISKLCALEKLCITVHPGDQRWNNNAEAITLDASSLNELTNFQFYFPDVKFLDLFIQKSVSWRNNRLNKFNFVVGQNVRRIVSRVPVDIEFDYNQQDRCFRFLNGDEISTAVSKVLVHATAFYIDRHCKMQSLSDFGITDMKELKFCILRECPNVLAIIDCDEMSEGALPDLEHLNIHYLWKLERICKGPMPRGSFNALRFLSVHTCPKLEFIIEEALLQCLSNLEDLVVEDCASLKKIIEMEEKTVEDDFVGLPSLKKLSLLYLPQLVSVWNGVQPSSMQISISHCPKLNLLKLSDSNKEGD